MEEKTKNDGEIKDSKEEETEGKGAIKDFKTWLYRNDVDGLEKTISIAILAIEIVLLFVNNVSGNVSFYIFTGLNCLFSFFIYLTFVKKKWNQIYSLDKKFETTPKYRHSYKYPDQKEEPAGQLKSREESELACEAIEQFRIIRYAWLGTAALYVVFIINKLLVSDESLTHFVEDYKIKPIANTLIIFLSLLSSYFYLVVYNVMYRETITSESGTNANKKVHIKNTMWFLGLILTVMLLYIISYKYYIGHQSDHIEKISFSGEKYMNDTLLLLGEKYSFETSRNYSIVHDSKEDEVHEIIKEGEKSDDTLTIMLYNSHRLNTIIQDDYHDYIRIKHCCDDYNTKEVDGRLKLIVKHDANIRHIGIDKSIKNVEVTFGDKYLGVSSVDFFFQCLVGLITALIMCFFVGRFESLTFQTPGWVLLILYFYAVIQGFLVILDNDFFGDNEYLYSIHDTVIKAIFFIALMGKVVLYVYIQGTYETKRLFYYFVETRKEKKNLKDHWDDAYKEIIDSDIEWDLEDQDVG